MNRPHSFLCRLFSMVSGILFFLLQIHIPIIDSRENPEEDASDRKDDPGAHPSIVDETGNQIDGGCQREDDTSDDTD